MKYDLYKKLYEKNATFLNSRSLAKKALPLLDKVLTAICFVAYAILCIFAIVKKFKAVDMLPIFFAPMLGLLTASVLRLFLDRPRPYSEQGAGITPLATKKKSGSSFPSRHLACATVIATTCLPYVAPLGIFLYFTALLLAYIRFALGWHYPTDLLAGVVVGVLCGAFAFLL